MGTLSRSGCFRKPETTAATKGLLVGCSLLLCILSDFSDSLLKRYGITEKPQRERVNPGSQITELEQKKPRRKDTPAIHIPPLIIAPNLLGDHKKSASHV
uniref:Protein phosphatase 1 regulatory subunit 17 n=1 Tax=Amazona collaria TaxID=241587 RepID=A0A8B9G3G4_9PSIT